MANGKDAKSMKEPANQGAIIDEHGREVPITEEMIQQAFSKIKPKSIGWKTGMMEIITDEMLDKKRDK